MRHPTVRAAWAFLTLAAICAACTQGKITTDPLTSPSLQQTVVVNR